jgi:hypothetical protein
MEEETWGVRERENMRVRNERWAGGRGGRSVGKISRTVSGETEGKGRTKGVMSSLVMGREGEGVTGKRWDNGRRRVDRLDAGAEVVM